MIDFLADFYKTTTTAFLTSKFFSEETVIELVLVTIFKCEKLNYMKRDI